MRMQARYLVFRAETWGPAAVLTGVEGSPHRCPAKGSQRTEENDKTKKCGKRMDREAGSSEYVIVCVR